MGDFKALRRGPVRIASVFIITLLFAVTASAYTIVLYGGRRIEIPARFVVTAATLTYEAAPRIQITLAMSAIDVAATEKANNETPGSLFRRAPAGARELASRPAASLATRTITNRDLETSRRRRLASELAYETRRRQLGLPTLEESRRQAAAIPDLAGTELEQKLVAEKQSEEYWRARASVLRTEMAALDAELSSIRVRLDEMPSGSWIGAPIISRPFAPVISSGSVGGRHSFPGSARHRSLAFGTAPAAPQLSGRVRLGDGALRGQAFLNPWNPGRRPMGGVFPATAIYGRIGPIGQPFDFSYERSELIIQFNELETARAGMSARWRELEDEARRAGAPPGWLRR
jgi:hypothetical protein